MPVVFDEVVGNVAPESPSVGEGVPPTEPREPSADNLQRQLRQMELRAFRLRAD
jgi:hypothetical protein